MEASCFKEYIPQITQGLMVLLLDELQLLDGKRRVLDALEVRRLVSSPLRVLRDGTDQTLLVLPLSGDDRAGRRRREFRRSQTGLDVDADLLLSLFFALRSSLSSLRYPTAFLSFGRRLKTKKENGSSSLRSSRS